MVGRDDNEVLNLYRGECKFAALHMSAFGTKLTYRTVDQFVRLRGKADIPREAQRSGLTRMNRT
jgi:hypothetical protein